MKKALSVLLFLSLLSVIFTGCISDLPPVSTEPVLDTSTHHLILVTDQQNACLSLYDLNDSDWSKPRWSWKPTGFKLRNVDGAKYRFDPHSQMDVIAFCSGSLCGIVSYPVGELLAYVEDPGGNPHSVEILPDGAFVLCGTQGNYVRIYDTTYYGDMADKYTEISLPVVHGVLWDDEYEVLWALSTNRLYALRVDEAHNMTVLDDMTVNLPSGHGHDLQPDYGNPDILWVTTDTNVHQVRKSTRETLSTYPGWLSVSATPTVKGIGCFADGTLVYAQQNGTFREWNTNLVTVGIYNKEEDRYYYYTRELPGAIYKLRVFEKRYK